MAEDFISLSSWITIPSLEMRRREQEQVLTWERSQKERQLTTDYRFKPMETEGNSDTLSIK